MKICCIETEVKDRDLLPSPSPIGPLCAVRTPTPPPLLPQPLKNKRVISKKRVSTPQNKGLTGSQFSILFKCKAPTANQGDCAALSRPCTATAAPGLPPPRPTRETQTRILRQAGGRESRGGSSAPVRTRCAEKRPRPRSAATAQAGRWERPRRTAALP